MFEFVRRMLGRRGSPADGPPPGTVALVAVQGLGGAQAPFDPADLVAHDAAGARLLSCKVAARPDPRLATAGAAPALAGEYRLEAVLPPRQDTAGLALFGPNPVLRLRALDPAATSGLSRRNTLLIHGGPAGPPTDGAIRMADTDLARLLAVLPPHLAGVAVRLVPPAQAEAADIWDESMDTAWQDSWPDSEDAALYEQLHGWTEPPAGTPAYPDLTMQAAEDRDVATALAALGYAVLPGPAASAPEPADAGTTSTGSRVPVTPGPEPGFTPTPVALPDAGWTPSGGAYGR